jgi:hypothetical protein
MYYWAKPCRTPKGLSHTQQGCHIVYFQTKNPNLGKHCRALDLKMLICIFYGHLEYFMAIWDILWPFGTFCVHLVHFSVFGIMYEEKSGNPVVCRNRFVKLLTKKSPGGVAQWTSNPPQEWEDQKWKKCTKWTQNVPNEHKMYQMVIKYPKSL